MARIQLLVKHNYWKGYSPCLFIQMEQSCQNHNVMPVPFFFIFLFFFSGGGVLFICFYSLFSGSHQSKQCKQCQEGRRWVGGMGLLADLPSVPNTSISYFWPHVVGWIPKGMSDLWTCSPGQLSSSFSKNKNAINNLRQILTKQINKQTKTTHYMLYRDMFSIAIV